MTNNMVQPTIKRRDWFTISEHVTGLFLFCPPTQCLESSIENYLILNTKFSYYKFEKYHLFCMTYHNITISVA